MTSFVTKLGALALLGALIPLGGCGTTDRFKTSSIPLDDNRARHPIVISENKTSIDVFPSLAEGHLDRHTAKQVFAFAQQYHDTGRGAVLILMPRGPGARANHALLADLRRYLSAGGARNGVEVASYPVMDPHLASPVRLSFDGLRAQVADQCGQWPRDLASGSSVDGWDNKPYWNFGCANQTMIAAQTSDPRDLVTPRGEESSDVLIRSRGIDSIRKGTDPNTGWSVHNSNIGSVGAN